MDRYASGDDSAFSDLYDALAPRLYGYLFRQTRQAAQAEDLVQKTLLRIHQARGRFVRGAPVFPWAMAIARRLLIDDMRRARARRTAGSLDDPNVGVEPVDPAPSASETAAAKELAARIQAEVERLPANQRDAWVLVKDEGMSLAEAAAVLGATVTAVKLRIHRASLTLRAILGEEKP